MALTTEAVLNELKKCGIKFVVALPDDRTQRLYQVLSQDPDITLVPVCREEEAVLICAGLYFGGQESALLVQNTGMFNAVNALRGVALDLRVPTLLVISCPGLLSQGDFRSSEISKGQFTRPILDALSIPYEVVEEAEEIAAISQAHRFSQGACGPAAVLLGKEVV